MDIEGSDLDVRSDPSMDMEGSDAEMGERDQLSAFMGCDDGPQDMDDFFFSLSRSRSRSRSLSLSRSRSRSISLFECVLWGGS